jgi:hypothetical protein
MINNDLDFEYTKTFANYARPKPKLGLQDAFT